MSDQYIDIESTVYLHAGANDENAVGNDGTAPTAVVRACGAGASSPPITAGIAVDLLDDAGYPAGAYEIGIAATVANGYAADTSYAVFFSLAVGTANPTGFIGRFHTKPVLANTVDMDPAVIALIQASLATEAKQDAAQTDITAIRGKTNQMVFTAANQLDVNVLAMAAAVITAINAGMATEAKQDSAEGKIDGVKAKTDLMQFTPTNELRVAIDMVNDSGITGSGTEVDPWGPV